ncbi:Cap22 protein [Colletotrichum higginsianum IMI 349063]|uniref:Cap22 protein n=1 Tax=Colletotrichum higginsianum (strain IMI 349063) TaxID=759273 RepID=A0A1B7XQP2_COLHI|nr:Cap22 protein [Colletotrichum higginsianum IMI 349063]OBR02073.1 Cap22 protein [Colletotrichum higginsianum IMI 349063]
MRFNNVALSLAAVAYVKANVQLFADEIPIQCLAVCNPIFQLGRICEGERTVISNGPTEDRLEAQCVCTNTSFDVSKYAGLCASCMSQNVEDRDDLEVADQNDKDINDILWTCGFPSTSYVPTASYASFTPSVQATPLTNSAQLTTTIDPRAGGGASPTQSSASGNNGGTSSGNPTTASSQATQTPNGAGVVSSQAGLGLVGAVAVGACFL